MAGVQIDGVNNKIDFDDDLDTSISANTDDTLVIEAGGNTMATFTATTLTINDGTTITTADNTDTLTLKSTDADGNSGPILRLNRDSGSPADGDVIGEIHFNADDDAGNTTQFFSMSANIRDASNGDEDVQMVFKGFSGGNNVNYLEIDGNHVVFNEGSADIDFRVESNSHTHMLFVDGGNNRVGVKLEPDLGDGLHIKTGDSGVSSINASHDELIIEGSGNSGIAILSSTSNAGAICFGDSDNNCIAYLNYDHGSNRMSFGVDNAERIRINSTGRVNIGDVTNSHDGVFTTTQETAGDGYALFGRHKASSGTVRLLRGSFAEQAPDDSTSVFITMGDSSTTRFNVAADGDVTNHDNAYGQISDERIKTNITDANSQWADIKAIKVKNFERKDDVTQYGEGKKVQIGVVAQEVETVSPGLIKEGEPTIDDIKMSSAFGTLYTADDAETKDGNDAVLYTAEDAEVIDGAYNVGDVKTEATHSKKIGDIKSLTGEKVKKVSYSVLYMKAIKALQEAQTRIETLETKVAALEG